MSNQQAQINMINNALDWAGIKTVRNVRTPSARQRHVSFWARLSRRVHCQVHCQSTRDPCALLCKSIKRPLSQWDQHRELCQHVATGGRGPLSLVTKKHHTSILVDDRRRLRDRRQQQAHRQAVRQQRERYHAEPSPSGPCKCTHRRSRTSRPDQLPSGRCAAAAFWRRCSHCPFTPFKTHSFAVCQAAIACMKTRVSSFF